MLFGKRFIEVLKFHEPGLASVKDDSGAYHITTDGLPLYTERYSRTFGYYFNRAAVDSNGDWSHIDELGKPAYAQTFDWVGNFQQEVCTVRDREFEYFHINLKGESLYEERYAYAGDFKDGTCCVKVKGSGFRHIDSKGAFIHDGEFLDLGVFHKGFACARDEHGWFHIDIAGKQLYQERYQYVEPFYNGQALVMTESRRHAVLMENSNELRQLGLNP